MLSTSTASAGGTAQDAAAALPTAAAERPRDPSFLDHLPATLAADETHADLRAFMHCFKLLFAAYDGPQPLCRLSYLALTVESHTTHLVMGGIVRGNNDPRLHVRLFGDAVPASVALRLVDQPDTEKLRAALDLFLPDGPHGRGWADPISGGWRLADMRQELLAGPLTPLPLTAPEGSQAAFPHYATQVFVHHLREYAHYNAADEAELRAMVTATKLTYSRSSPDPLRRLDRLWATPEQLQQLPPEEEEAAQRSVLDLVTWPAAGAALPSSAELFVAVFACYDGGSPQLSYVQLDGNAEAVERLRAIAAACGDEDFRVRVWPDASALTPAAMQRLMDTADEEQLRRLLSDALPGGPEGDGWGDRDMWTVGELLQSALPGRVGLLPVEPPADFDHDNGDYAVQLFSLHLEDIIKLQPEQEQQQQQQPQPEQE